MKRRMYAKVLAAAMAVSLVATGVAGCGNEKKEESKAKTEANLEITEEDPNEEAVEKLKTYIPKVDKIDVVENAKNLDMDKAVSSLVTPEKAGEVEKVTVEDTKLDPKKTGTYEVTVTVALKEAADQAGAGADTENTAEAAAETKQQPPTNRQTRLPTTRKQRRIRRRTRIRRPTQTRKRTRTRKRLPTRRPRMARKKTRIWIPAKRTQIPGRTRRLPVR